MRERSRIGIEAGRLLRRSLFGLAAVGILSWGCTPPIKQYEMKDLSVSCEEANRYSLESLGALEFAVTSFEPAVPGRPGVLRGSRDRAQRGRQSVTVRIECTGAGAHLDASEDGAVMDRVDFKRAFYLTFVSVRSMTERHAEFDQKVVSGTAPDSQQRKDVRVLVDPVRGQAAKLDFDVDMETAGILPVRFRINNLTPRSYEIDPEEIRLTRSDRVRVEALSVRDAASRIVGARSRDGGAPLTTLSVDDLAARLRGKLFAASRVAPGAQADGFLYFPMGQYTRARVVLTETESGETEGVMVEF